jgi:hypothetical protein
MDILETRTDDGEQQHAELGLLPLREEDTLTASSRSVEIRNRKGETRKVMTR